MQTLSIAGSHFHMVPMCAAGLCRLESLNLDSTFGSDNEAPSWSFLQHVTGLTELSWAAPCSNAVVPRTDDVGLIKLGAHAASLTKLKR